MSTEAATNLPAQQYERPGTAVATRAVDNDAALNERDILIPRMKIAQMISRVVSDEVAEYGALYIVASQDDMEPTILADAAPKGELSKPVRFYIHGDPRKGWSWKPAREGDDWRGREYPDLRLVRDQDPRNVRRTYDFLVTLPDYSMLPVRFMMHGQWGGQAAKQINTQLLLNRQRGVESHTVPFKLQTKKTSSPQGGQERPFVAAIVGLDKVPAKDAKADRELVESHRTLIGAANVSELSDDDAQSGKAAANVNAPSLD